MLHEHPGTRAAGSLLAAKSTNQATSHTITFDTASAPGSDVLLFIKTSAVINSLDPAWVKDYEAVGNDAQYVYRLPGAQNGSGISSVTIGLSGSRAMSVVAVEDYVQSVHYSGFTTASIPDAGATGIGTGLHTFALSGDPDGDSTYAVFWRTSGSADAGRITTLDNGYTLLGQTGTTEQADEDFFVAVGHKFDGSFSNNGVSATMGTAFSVVPDGLAGLSGMISYTRRASVDTAPPTVVSRTPASAATGVSTSAAITATFNENLAGSPTIALSPTVTGTPSVSGASITFTPSSALAANTTYTVTVSGIQDAAGNAASNVSWSFTTAAAAPPPGDGIEWGPTIADEIALDAAPLADWDLPGNPGGVDGGLGYAKQFSVNAGSTVQFAVDGNQVSNIDIYRIGGYSTGWRYITTISNTPTTQPAPLSIANSNGAVTCSNWSATASWTVSAGAWSGMYVAVPQIGSTNGSWIPFVVRQDARAADLVVKTSETTWGAAYNYYGGKGAAAFSGASLYTDAGPDFNGTARAYAVSMDRPVVTRAGIPQTYWLAMEAPMWAFLDKQGVDWKMISSLDLDAGISKVDGAKAVMSLGHDEYWTQGMRDNALLLRDRSVHWVFATANEIFWRVRFEGSSMWCYKDTLNNGVQLDPVEWTGTWRDTRWVDRAPENELTGTFFRMNGIVDGDIVVDAATYGSSPFWRGTSVASGTNLTLTGCLGFEADERSPATANNVTLAQTTRNIDSKYADDNGQNYDGNGSLDWGIVMQAHGSAVTVGFGTNQWSWALDQFHDRTAVPVFAAAQQATINLLTDMGAPASTPKGGLVAPEPMALSSYGLTVTEPVLQDYYVSDGARWWRVGSAAAHEAAANPHDQYLIDAPVDGKQYARKNSAWSEVAATGAPVLVLGPTDPVPGGTAAGTVIVRKEA